MPSSTCLHKNVEIILERRVTATTAIGKESLTLSVLPDSFTDEEPVDFICLDCGVNLSTEDISEIIGL